MLERLECGWWWPFRWPPEGTFELRLEETEVVAVRPDLGYRPSCQWGEKI